MSQQRPSSAVRAAHALGLTVFLATAAFLAALLITWIGKAPDSLPEIALVFSTVCAIAAAFAMLVDAFDLWVRGRRMTPQGVKSVRMVVWVAVLGALATSILGKNTVLVVYLMPALFVYLFISRRRPAGAVATSGGFGAGGVRSSRSRSVGGRAAGGVTSKSRQRKGGKKHR